MTQLVFHHEPSELALSSSAIPVLMYGRRPPYVGSASIGGPVRAEVRRLGGPVHRRAFDFLTVAMAVTAADTFVDRQKAPDGWARELRLVIPVADPTPWQAAIPLLEETLLFLSGDIWSIAIVGDGPERPLPQTKGRLISLPDHDCVSLFSGGLDSAIGAIDLVAAGRRPVLISHSYRGDAGRQSDIVRELPTKTSRFSAVANPISLVDGVNDVQMRTRSFNFFAFGALVAATMAERGIAQGPVDLNVPENGLIALNPPLTPRRIGALSTRTTHPHYLELIQRLFDLVEIPVRITNPYAHVTKGEMLAVCPDKKTLEAIAWDTVSCGKWKRTGVQCGKCVPCLIRRASFHAAGIKDRTRYGDGADLSSTMAADTGRDDLLAMVLASRSLPTTRIGSWIAKAGPLPQNRSERDPLVGVAQRGLNEVRAYLESLGLLS
jgi:7-cyano-7-deazaguanine synthase in queuosine biosynthesis